MSLTAAASGFVVFFLCVPVVQSQNSWGVTYTSTQICALKGSTVDINCTYTYPSTINYRDTKVQETFWFTKESNNVYVDLRTDSKYSGRVEYISQNKRCTLRITDLRESDSAEYKFRFITNQPGGKYTGLPGVTLSVTALQMQVTRITVNQSYTKAELKCDSSCSPDSALSYVWFKNGQKVPEETSSYIGQLYPGDNISCALKGHEGFRSPPLYAPKLPSVSVSPSAEIVEGSSVTLTCSSDANILANLTWYKTNLNSEKLLSKEPKLVFSSIQSSDSGEYYCAAENQLGRRTTKYIIDVKYAPKLPSVSVSPSAEIVEGSSVTLTCSSDANPAANYTWYKENQTLIQGPEGIYRFTSISSEDRGIYYCRSKNPYGQINSTSLSLNVQYAPKPPSVSVSPSGEIVEGSSVNLTCSSDANPAANYTWYKENQTLLQGPEGIYRFTSISSQDRGIYCCKSENKYGQINSTSLFLNVQYAPKFPSASVSPSGEIVEGRSVNLTCSSDANPAANYTWYKKNQTLIQGPEGIYRFTSISSQDRGIYCCKSENKYGQINSTSLYLDVQYAPKFPSVSVSPSGEIMEGRSVNLTCSSDANPAANYTWYKKNQTLLQGPKGIYRFTSISSQDRGIYCCKSENKYGQINSSSLYLDVQYSPKLPSVSVSPSAEIVEGSSVTLTCSSDANPAAKYTWYKENQRLIQGPEGIYRFTSITSGDKGIYYCKSENKYGQINTSTEFIDVQYAPKLPSVSVSPSAEIVEGSSVTLTCSSDANPAANYTWYKENEDSPKASGKNFTITHFIAEYNGNYYCEAQNRRGRLKFTLYLAVKAEQWILISAGTIPAILILVLLIVISVILWIRKDRTTKQPPEPKDKPDGNPQKQPAEDNIHYASVHFSKKQADPLYSNITPSQPQRQEVEEEEDSVVYTTVKYNSDNTAPK
ncbi:B-cell receptor CD22-like [Micropterus salmoides]|uniref:B-cell receptor CD22-like n=1 Tax=Micropterus salmoides TaxID=27706 RepID=UPI0018EDF01E|nr:B-cell receptor CD22-like [Micropterus salmoides]